MFKNDHPKAGGGAKWGTEPKKASSKSYHPKQTAGAGYTGVKRLSNAGASYPTKPGKGR